MNRGQQMSDKELDEPILPDDYPIFADYCYVADGKVVRSDWHEVTAKQFKNLLGAKELRRCDMVARKILSAIAALGLMATSALAQQTSDSAAKAAAYASTGSTIFEAARSRNNTPDVFSNATQGTTDCQFPGFGFGIGQPGLGASISIPLGADADCKHERLAAFRMRTAELMMKSGEPVEARRNINAANESLCRVSYNIGTAMCAPTPAPQPMTVYYYCRKPAGYYPAVQGCQSWEMVPR